MTLKRDSVSTGNVFEKLKHGSIVIGCPQSANISAYGRHHLCFWSVRVMQTDNMPSYPH